MSLARQRLLHRIFCANQYVVEVNKADGMQILRGQGMASDVAVRAESVGEVVSMKKVKA